MFRNLSFGLSSKLFRTYALYLFVFLLSSPSYALNHRKVASKPSELHPVLWALRDDLTVPEKCRDFSIANRADEPLDFMTIGIKGALSRGFEFEYPITRQDATLLWKYIQQYMHNPRNPIRIREARLEKDFKILVENFEQMGFNFKAEGDVLELLAIVKIKSQLPKGYFVTGSVGYDDGERAGELDIVIGRLSDCQFETVAEVKLGLKELSHARKQLLRFNEFVSENLSPEAIASIGPLIGPACKSLLNFRNKRH